MLRRPPTRLELKPEDRQEVRERRKERCDKERWTEADGRDGTTNLQYEDIKRRREEEEAAAAGNQARPGNSLRELDKLKESVQERIGLKR